MGFGGQELNQEDSLNQEQRTDEDESRVLVVVANHNQEVSYRGQPQSGAEGR